MEQSEQIKNRQILLNQAAAHLSEGEKLNLQGKLSEAEYQYLEALKGYQRLWELTGTQSYADAAADCCENLADLSMQQGNMHGADYYYAQILKCQKLFP